MVCLDREQLKKLKKIAKSQNLTRMLHSSGLECLIRGYWGEAKSLYGTEMSAIEVKIAKEKVVKRIVAPNGKEYNAGSRNLGEALAERLEIDRNNLGNLVAPTRPS